MNAESNHGEKERAGSWRPASLVGRKVRIVRGEFYAGVVGLTGVVHRIVHGDLDSGENGEKDGNEENDMSKTSRTTMLIVRLDDTSRPMRGGLRIEKVWTYVSDLDFID